MDIPKLSPTERLILELLAGEEMFGLQLVEQSKGALKRGTVYVTLGRMQDKGYVESWTEKQPPGAIGLPRRSVSSDGLRPSGACRVGSRRPRAGASAEIAARLMIPGRMLHRLAARICSAKTLERVVEPAIADLQKEYAARCAKSRDASDVHRVLHWPGYPPADSPRLIAICALASLSVSGRRPSDRHRAACDVIVAGARYRSRRPATGVAAWPPLSIESQRSLRRSGSATSAADLRRRCRWAFPSGGRSASRWTLPIGVRHAHDRETRLHRQLSVAASAFNLAASRGRCRRQSGVPRRSVWTKWH